MSKTTNQTMTAGQQEYNDALRTLADETDRAFALA